MPDLLAAPGLVRINRLYYVWVMLGLIVPAAIGAGFGRGVSGLVDGFLWGGVVRLFVVEQSMSGINSFLHLFGSRSFDTPADNSRNSPWLGVLAWGEGWHNNHHAFPTSAAHGLAWWQIDVSYWVIRVMAWLRLAYDVKVPVVAAMAAKRVEPS